MPDHPPTSQPPPPPNHLPRPSRPAMPPPTCAPFDARRMDRELFLDIFSRWSAVVLVVVAILVFQTGLSTMDFWLLMIPVFIVWIGISAPSAKVLPLLGQIAAWIESDPPAAEAALAQSLARRPLQRQLRLQLYHRLAILRHYQSRLEESAAITQALVAKRLGSSEKYRPQLLLMLTEAKLLQGDLPGAYLALSELARLKLGLIESLQHLSLRTRYEVLAGYDQQALTDLPGKLHLAQMLPAAQCGSLHALWAIAAARQSDDPLRDWLTRRAQLLCEPAAYERFKDGQLTFAVERPLTVASA